MKEKMMELVEKAAELKKMMREISGEDAIPRTERSTANFLTVNTFHFMNKYVSEVLFRSLSREEAHEMLEIFERGY